MYTTDCNYFKITNYNTVQQGYYAWTGCTGIVSVTPSSFRMVQVSQTQYQVYGYFGSYTRGSSYSVQTSNLCSWVHSGLPVSDPSGNYIAISISTY